MQGRLFSSRHRLYPLGALPIHLPSFIAFRMLRFEADGFVIFYKRLEKGTFEIPAHNSQSSTLMLTDNELIFILKGVALNKVKYRPRYSQNKAVCE